MELQVRIAGIASDEIIESKLNDLHKQTIDHEITTSIYVQEEHDCHSAVITVKHKVSIPQSLMSYEMKSRTGFLLKSDDYSFLKHPTNPQTISVFVSLILTALSHARMFMMFETLGLTEEKIILPHYSMKELESMTRDNLISALN